MGSSRPRRPIPRSPAEPEGEVLAARLFSWGPGKVGVEFELKDGTRHARRAIVDEATAAALREATPWDGSEPH